jgi:hypothetical protein
MKSSPADRGVATRTILHPRAQEGWFRYNVTVGGVPGVEINLLTLAQQNNQLATLDPVTRALTNIRSAAGTAGNDHGAHQPEHAAILIRAPGRTRSIRRPGASTSTCRRTIASAGRTPGVGS